MASNDWISGGGGKGCCSLGRSLSDLFAEYQSLPDGPEKEVARIRHDGALIRTKTSEQVLAELRALPRCDPPSPEQRELARQVLLLRDCEEILRDLPIPSGRR